ncbi:MAG TPA: tRNA (adenosine(37)-N6)-dimethylallyltransferase MiaA [Oscillospiraceae bacterium]|nr:tRNA (adenosine(37)-N6)-dimethylallyltransferase MiaA [Oscillospiraceae bacterium]
MDKLPLVVIVGPTASGKTALSIETAKRHNGEIVSADSMQIYKGMNIASAKPTEDEKQGIPHHLMGFLDITEKFSVADYLEKARNAINDIHDRGKLPIVVGGTGLYVSSIIDNVKFDSIKSDGTVRERLTRETDELGAEAMLDRLMEVDKETAQTLHPNNRTRIIRALEVFELTGTKLSIQKDLSRAEESPYYECIIGLNFNDRSDLYDRINQRVDIMINQGLIDEAKEIYDNYSLKTACQAIGYKELIPYFNGEEKLEVCIDKIKQETRRYAKRQLTWFRRDERINWIMMDKDTNFENIINKCEKIIANSDIL